MTAPQIYQSDDIQQILQLAIARNDREGEFTRTQLLEIAEELEIPLTCLEAAEQDWRLSRLETEKRQEFDRYRFAQFRHKAVKYMILAGFFMSLDLLSGGGLGWSRYLVVVLVTLSVLGGWKIFQPKGPAYERELAQWESRRQLQQTLNTAWQSIRSFFRG
ncbi:2TM domain-containing protein [Spirulina major]|uniref:2TM domain-containing protein n=1 Tax=Spirulina major TaxID=270636 RepID=UPI000934FCEB|nr:2TM domain-containing protein [Spirulina major]